MEPIATGPVLTALGKLGAGAASGSLKNLLNKRLLRFRVSWASAHSAKRMRIEVSPRAIRHWLSRDDVQRQLSAGTSTALESAVKNLAWRLAGEEETREKAAAVLLRLVLQEYLRAQSPADAVVLANGWTQSEVRSDGDHTRTIVADQTDILLEALKQPDMFEKDVAKLHPWRRLEATELGQTWPVFRSFIHTMCIADSPGTVLEQWASNHPVEFANAPAEAWCWFGLAASDYGRHGASHAFITRGIEAGASPSNYWWARTALNFAQERGDHQQARRAIEQAEPTHPLGLALQLMLDGNYPGVERALQQWDPTNANDITIRELLLSQCALGQEDLNKAIAIALETCSQNPDASGPMLRAAEMLLSRGLHGISDNPLADFAQAHALAVRARDGRRAWKGDSVAPILVAIKASALGTETDQAWRHTQGPPEGVSTAEEIRDPRLRRETAILAACMSNFDLARRVAEEIDEPYSTAMVRAFSSLNEGDDATAESEWMQAWDLASDDYERLQAANALAPMGGSMPDLTGLAARHPYAVEKISTIHRIMSVPGDRLTILRARAHEAEILTVLLAEQLSAAGQYSEAAKALESGAQRWNSPLLEKMAAARYLHAGEYAKAAESANSALAMAGSWGDELDVLRLRLDALEAQGLHDESLRTVRRMIGLAPNNQSVRWALIHCLVRSGDSAAAWAALTGLGQPIQPRDLQDARVWISLASQHDTSPLFVGRSLDVMRRFPDDAEFMGSVLAQIYFGLSRNQGEVSETDLKALHAATDSFTEEHPKSTSFRAIPIGPERNPLAALEQEFKNRKDSKALEELEGQILNGELPLGIATEVSGRSYAEFAIQRGAGLVYSHNPAQALAGELAVAAALGNPVAIDTTAAVSLSLLDPEIAHQLTGVFSSLESTHSSYRDAQAAQQMLHLRSTMSSKWSEVEQRLVSFVMSSEDADRAANRADKTVETLRACNRRNWAALRHVTDLELNNGVWLSTLDYAIESKTVFWSDDVLLRVLAQEHGLKSFGTVDLIRELVRVERVQPELGVLAESVLLANFHVDLGFNLEVMRLAAELTGWEGAGVAAALTRPSTWERPGLVADFLHEALSKVAPSSPASAEAWVQCAALGVIRIVEDADPASANLRLLLGQLFPQPWMRPDILPFVIRGIRAASNTSGLSVDDPLQSVLAGMHQKLVEEHGSAAAAEFLLMWVRHLEPADRQTAGRIILTSTQR
jgi:tetratricopeptide (TPR) repeat protein